MGISYEEVRSENVPAADTVQYTVAAGTTVEVTHATMTSVILSTQTYNLFTPNPTASGAAANTLINTKSVLQGTTDLMPELLGKRFDAGTVIRTSASSGSAFNLHLSLMVRTV